MPGGKSAHFSLTWDRYRNVMCDGFSTLQQTGEFVDMTIAADGHLVKVHQMIVGLASPYLKELIRSAPCPHPVIFLNNVSHQILCNILEYVYTGEVAVEAEKLTLFIETAKALHIKGLDDLDRTGSHQVSSYQVEPVQHHKSTGSSTLQIQMVPPKTIEVSLSPPNAPKVMVKRDMPLISTTPDKRSIVIDSTASKVVMNEMVEYIEEDIPMDQSADEDNLTTDQMTPQFKTKANAAKQGDLQFTISNRGALQLILNRYMYNLASRSRDGRSRRWKCVDYRNQKCPAVAVTDDNMVVTRVAMHNHPFHDRRILGKIEKKCVYSAIKQAEEAGANIDTLIDD